MIHDQGDKITLVVLVVAFGLVWLGLLANGLRLRRRKRLPGMEWLGDHLRDTTASTGRRLGR